MTHRIEEYIALRRKNFDEGIQKVLKKYGLKQWVTYKNLERAREQND